MSVLHVPGRVDFSVPEAQWLADLHGIENDLRDTERLCDKCLALMRSHPLAGANPAEWIADSWVAGELSFAAVVKYGRTLGSGVRAGIPSTWVNALPADHQEAHRYFKNLRDKFIAHSVNAFEDNQVFACLYPQTAPAEVKSITVDTGRFVSLSSTDVVKLKALTRVFAQMVQQEIGREASRVLEVARRIPIAELLTRETENRPIPGVEDVAKPRPKA